MSYWNHRLVKDVESGRLAIHEVYYDDDGTPTGYTENPVFIDTFNTFFFIWISFQHFLRTLPKNLYTLRV